MKKINNKKISIILTAVIFFGCALCGCQTAPKEIPDDLTAAQLIQRGQDAAANYNYVAANAYYVACIERYQADLKCYIEARYEIAQLNYKQRKYDIAKAMYQEILDTFDDPSAVYQLQPKYKKLAQIGLDKIKAIEDKKQQEAEKKAAKKAAKEKAKKTADEE
ncbi:hypothetical protein [Treponema sp.]|uniref:hypothetical protein n=1 Tax=Treponema sp. TaxID=166 RepID=UPI00388EC35C